MPASTHDTVAPVQDNQSSGAQQLVEDVERKQFVKRRLDSVLTTAQHIYSRVEDVSEKNALVRMGLSTFNRSTSWLQAPLQQTFNRFGQPVVQKVDSGLAVVYTAAKQRVSALSSVTQLKDSVMDTDWLRQVDSTLRTASSGTSTKFNEFYAAAQHSLSATSEKTFDQFLDDLKKQLSHWDDQYVSPAREYYRRSQRRVQDLDLSAQPRKLGGKASEVLTGLRAHIARSWDTHVVGNATSLYRTAVDTYLQVSHPEDISVTDEERAERREEFLAAMKARLDRVWSDRLTQLLRQFYDRATLAGQDDLKKLRTALDLSAKGPMRRKLSGVVAQLQGYVGSGVKSALDLSERTVDYLLPEDEQQPQDSNNNDKENQQGQDKPVSKSVSQLAGRVSHRLLAKASQNVQQLRQFSSHRLQPLIHVDLVSYAENVIATVAKKASDAQLLALDTAKNTTNMASNALDSVSSTTQQRLSPHVEQLRLKLQVARKRAALLSKHTVAVVGAKKVGDVLSDTADLVLKVVGVRSKGQELLQTQTHAKELLAAVIDLLCVWRKCEAAEASKPPAVPAAKSTSTSTPQQSPDVTEPLEEQEEQADTSAESPATAQVHEQQQVEETKGSADDTLNTPSKQAPQPKTTSPVVLSNGRVPGDATQTQLKVPSNKHQKKKKKKRSHRSPATSKAAPGGGVGSELTL